MICAFLIPVTVMILSVLSRMLNIPPDLQDEVSIAQLRHVINCSSEFETSAAELSFIHHESRQRLVLRNGNLCLIDPGTQIFLSALSDVTFFEDGGLLYLTYSHYEKEPVTRCIGHL